ncbi:MarR family winged helix-turn-helix transcriptional regulator [Deinococcus humi]|uniref:DNA-binding MarR family transcriptional regulator n=1 Tax=Deinococcus humi TaxID=662880 RepID=A0A7W8JWF4_9DEIO|nr:MarR family winged helix-turn-helix transcriptional regulator [Deinococcus humi]MBB5363198.1 DNA-binding MarR family transcriptional regulator [Deinococcus humi]GGO27713.1 transcriptional regulator [Deinococcus humi]
MNLPPSPSSELQSTELYDLIRLTLRLSRRFRQALDEPLATALGLNTKELLVLASIMDGAQTPGRIASKQNLPAPTVTRIVSKQVAAGLVERVSDPADLRCFQLRLTPQGEATRARTRETGQAIVASHFGHLPPQRVHAALKAMQDLHDALNAPLPEEPRSAQAQSEHSTAEEVNA